jgi:M6 family metalloprotease-like protein
MNRFIVVCGLLLLGSGSLGAQDVEVQGRAYDIGPPAWVTARLQQDPTAFEFRRVWKQKVRRIRLMRQAVAPLLGPSYSAAQLVAQAASVTGTMSIPVLAGLYSDATAPYTPAEYQNRLFGDGAGSVSLSEYYQEVSGGLFSMTGQVSDWMTLAKPANYYEPSSETDETFGRIGEFLRDVLTGADDAVDFSQFDNDGPDGTPNSGDDDGYVDVAAFIYAAEPASCGGPGIWPHRWVYEAHWGAAFTTNDASANGGFIRVSDYVVQAGLECGGGGIMASGTIAHEMGHGLDLPDLYDTDPDDGTDSEGIGHWGLMGSGNWNRPTWPAHMSAWSKDFLGWVDVSVLASNQTGLQLQAVQTSRSVIRIDVPGTSEYFLLSNRQSIGSDLYLHGLGLLIWHIDQSVIDAKAPYNRVNSDAEHKGVDLEDADGLRDLDFSVNRGDTGDPFPGSTGNTEFHALSNPGSLSYQGSLSGLAIRNVSHISGVITLDLVVDEFALIVWGDVNGDAAVDAADVDLLYLYALGYAVDETHMANGDVDADGDVDFMDGFIIHSHVQGIDTSQYRVGQYGAASTPVPTAQPVTSNDVDSERVVVSRLSNSSSGNRRSGVRGADRAVRAG